MPEGTLQDILWVMISMLTVFGFNGLTIEIDELIPSKFKASVFGLINCVSRIVAIIMVSLGA